MFEIQNRRYTGCKYKLMGWIRELILENCEGDSFFDVFGGTGAVTNSMIDSYNKYILNDFLFSNEIVYKGFFLQEEYDEDKLISIKEEYNNINTDILKENYVSENFGDKFFRHIDAKVIGFIREDIQSKLDTKLINNKEYCILIASLLYSLDRCANTVGHYDAYIKGKQIRTEFIFDLIQPIKLGKNQEIKITREDANELSRNVKADIAFIDPPYNSRQYSRFYHVLENITQWKKPTLTGVALKPEPENMSDYCRNAAPKVFKDLIENLDVSYIVVTYNNNYSSKSSSSRNKITLEEIEEILSTRGETTRYEQSYRYFNTGKTSLDDHKEIVFITKVKKEEKKKILKTDTTKNRNNKSKKKISNENSSKKNIIRSPFFYVGDKYKLMHQINDLIPKNVSQYIEPFVGGGSSAINSLGSEYILNDIDEYVIKLHEELIKYLDKPEDLFDKLFKLIDHYGLSCSFRGIVVPDELKKQHVKTYYAKYNKEAYNKMRDDFNETKDITLLYLLLIYGFNHMIRFNGSGKFNLPVGNVDFNKNVYKALNDYLDFMKNNKVKFYNKDYQEFLLSLEIDKDAYVFLDPPYLISMSEYNKLWNEEKERELCEFLDQLNDRGVKFGITNLITHKGKENTTFKKWSEKYIVHPISSNYISFNDNTIKKDSIEVFVTNYNSNKNNI